MTVHITIDREEGIETGIFEDYYDLPSVQEFWAALANHPDHDPRRHQLVDLRQASLCAVDVGELQTIAEQTQGRARHRACHENRSAALISSDAGESDVRILRLFIAFMAHRRPELEDRMRIFRDEGLARRWLTTGSVD